MNALQAFTDSPMVQRLGWTLLHSIWQALGIAIGLAVALPIVRRAGARAGYALCCGALLLTILLPALTFVVLPRPSMTRMVSENTTSIPIANVSLGTATASRGTQAVE